MNGINKHKFQSLLLGNFVHGSHRSRPSTTKLLVSPTMHHKCIHKRREATSTINPTTSCDIKRDGMPHICLYLCVLTASVRKSNRVDYLQRKGDMRTDTIHYERTHYKSRGVYILTLGLLMQRRRKGRSILILISSQFT